MTKAHFTFEYNGKISDLFENDFITEQTLSKIGQTNVSTLKYLRKVITASDLGLFKKDNPISLDYYSLYDIVPEQINCNNIDQRISFKLKSKSIHIIDLKNNNITFSNHDNKIINIEIPNNYKLYKNLNDQNEKL